MESEILFDRINNNLLLKQKRIIDSKQQGLKTPNVDSQLLRSFLQIKIPISWVEYDSIPTVMISQLIDGGCVLLKIT